MNRTVRSVLVATAIILGVGALAVLGAGAYVIYHDTTARFVGAETAEAAFDEVARQFANTRPLVDLRGVDLPVLDRSAAAPRHEVRMLHVLSYDARSRKLVRVDLPGWMLKWMSARGTIRIANLEMFDAARDRLTLEDIERHTPGVIVSGTGRTRVLVWTE